MSLRTCICNEDTRPAQLVNGEPCGTLKSRRTLIFCSPLLCPFEKVPGPIPCPAPLQRLLPPLTLPHVPLSVSPPLTMQQTNRGAS